jgi:hypothetical protein
VFLSRQKAKTTDLANEIGGLLNLYVMKLNQTEPLNLKQISDSAGQPGRCGFDLEGAGILAAHVSRGDLIRLVT